METAVWNPCATNAHSTGGECGGARTCPVLLLVMVHPLIVAVPPIEIAPVPCVTNACT